MPRINVQAAPTKRGTGYPAPFSKQAAERLKRALGDAAGLTDFGVNLTQLPPGQWSSQRHWHTEEDEFVYILSGEVTLVTDAGREVLKAGECAGFPKGVADGHHLINDSGTVAVYLEIGARRASDVCAYPDVDLHYDPKDGCYTHKDGSPYLKP